MKGVQTVNQVSLVAVQIIWLQQKGMAQTRIADVDTQSMDVVRILLHKPWDLTMKAVGVKHFSLDAVQMESQLQKVQIWKDVSHAIVSMVAAPII